MARAAWEGVLVTLVEERCDALSRYARLLCGSADDAADLVQDALVKTFGRIGNGFSVAGAEAYVRRTILNSYLDRGRRISRWRRIAHLTAVPDVVDTDDPGARIDLFDELRRLTPRERACLVLRYYEDLKVDDVARELGISSGAVKRYLSDGLAKMAVALAEPDDGSTGAPPRSGRATTASASPPTRAGLSWAPGSQNGKRGS